MHVPTHQAGKNCRFLVVHLEQGLRRGDENAWKNAQECRVISGLRSSHSVESEGHVRVERRQGENQWVDVCEGSKGEDGIFGAEVVQLC